MICPNCGRDNIPGAEVCGRCRLDLTHLDRPVALDRIERALIEATVADLPPAPAVILGRQATVGAALAQMVRVPVTAVLVVEPDGQLAGIFSERDAVRRLTDGVDHRHEPLERHMTPAPVAVAPDEKLAAALRKLEQGGFRHLPVVAGQGRPVGVIADHDLVRFVAAQTTTAARR